MKKIFVLLLMLFLSVPVFAVPGEYTVLANGVKICDTSEQQAYFEKLEKQFFEKHKDGKISGMEYDKEVRVPLLNFEANLQKKGYCGYMH